AFHPLPSDCSKYPNEDNADVSELSKKGNHSVGDKIVFDCRIGYSSLKKITYICSDNEWIKIRGETCSPKRCELPEDIPNGQYEFVTGTDFVFGSTIKYICKEGFQMASRVYSRTCRPGGWDNMLPTCEEVVCLYDKMRDEMLQVHGLPFHEDIRYGHKLTFSCPETGGLTLEGPKEITCQVNGTWSSPFPKCVEATCPLNETMEGMTIERSPDVEGPVKQGQSIRFSCSENGMKLKGLTEITCLPNGEWNGPFPKCDEIRCEAILSKNMRAESDEQLAHEISVKPHQKVTLSCDGKGSKLIGERVITCNQDGQWSNTFPICTGGTCGSPPHVNNSDTVGFARAEYTEGEEVKYTCFNKYTLDTQHPHTKSLICQNGEWIGNIYCLKPCSVSVAILEERGLHLKVGGLQKIFSPHGDHITFICPRGRMNGKPRNQCNDGVMELPRCLKMKGYQVFLCLILMNAEVSTNAQDVVCEDEERINVEIVLGHPNKVSPYKVGQILVFQCTDRNMMMDGPRTVECQSNGKWDNPFPKCETSRNMRADEQTSCKISVKPQQTVTLSCDEKGTRLIGTPSVTCNQDGLWSDLFPKCTRDICGSPPHVNNADTLGFPRTEYTEGEEVKYTCFNKYTLDTQHPHTESLICQNGEWIGNIYCLKPCSVSVDVLEERGLHLRFAGLSRIFSPHGEYITFICPRGRMIGTSRNQCIDGVMELPRCV
ncbi:hypothetical protein DNTS_014272, partial [Danionella cerebrum]